MLLRNLHIGAAAIHIISCVLSVVLHVNYMTDLTLPKHTYVRDNITGIDTLTTHEKVLEQNAMVWISSNEAFTFFSHLIAVFYLSRDPSSRKYESLRRAVEYSLTAGILQVALVMGTGDVSVHDVIFLLMINGVLQVIGYVIDRLKDKPTERMILLASGFVLLASEIQYVLLSSLRLEGIKLDYFIVMGVFYALFYISFGVVKLFPTDKEDEIYILMSVTSKVTLSWLLIGNVFEGLKELGETTDPDFTTFDWRALQWGVILLSVLGLAIGIPVILNRDMTTAEMDKQLQVKQFKNLRY